MPPRSQPAPKGLGDALVRSLALTPTESAIRGIPNIGQHAKGLAATAVTAGSVLVLGEGGTQVALATVCASPLVWAAVHRSSFRSVGCAAVRGWRRRAMVYRPLWDEGMVGCSLMKRFDSEARIPRLVNVSTSEFFDHVVVKMLPGQDESLFMDASRRLARTFGSKACRVRLLEHRAWQRGSRVRLDFQRRDALAAVVPPVPIPVDEPVDLEAIPVGLTEYGEPWLLGLLGTHLLVGGATGSGKASVLWSILRGIAPDVRDGKVELWGFDAKNGLELEWGKPMFTRYWGKGVEVPKMATGLRDLVTLMDERADRLAGATRKHEPTIEDPLIVCVIDEAADLTTFEVKAVRDAINGDIAKILRKGRAVGVSLALFMQDPRKEAIPFRSLIPNGVGLRMKDTYEVDAILGPGAWKAGADCTDIPGAPEPGQPLDGRGVAFMTRMGETTPMRVRASFVTDADIAEMALEYPAFKWLSAEERRALEQEFEDNDEREPSKP